MTSAFAPAEPFLSAALQPGLMTLNLRQTQNLTRQLAGSVDTSRLKLGLRLLDEPLDFWLQVGRNVIKTHAALTRGP